MYRELSLVLLVLSKTLSGNKADYCGQKVFTGKNGTIKTNPELLDINISCLWTVHPPRDTITTIRILKTGLDNCPSRYPCCLSVSDGDSNRNYVKLCKEVPKKPVTLSVRGSKTQIYLEASQNAYAWINYFTRDSSECSDSDFQCYDRTGCYNASHNCNGDFTCSDHSDEVDCGKCPVNMTLCTKKSKNCFNPFTQRCDGVMDCPKGDDELGCSKLCPDAIKCSKDQKCIKQDQVCNSEVDCSDGFDEKTCPNEDSSTNIYLSFIFMVSIFCSMSFICIIFQWVWTRRNSRRFLNDPPEFPQEPFAGPGDQEAASTSTEIFTDSEFRQGGGIYESYVQSLKKTKPIAAVLSTTNQLSYMDLDGDNELIVLASLNVPVDMCIGLTVSQEKLNLSAALTKERLKMISQKEETPPEFTRSAEIQYIEENLQAGSSGCSEKISERTFIVSDSSEWTSISTSESSSKIIYVKSAQLI